MRVLFATALAALQSGTLWAQGQVDWNPLGSAFKAFLEYPSSDNAKAVSALLPTDHIAYGGGSDAQDSVIETIYQGLPMLARQVESRDREAVRLAFALFAVADGGFWEELDIMLGKLIRIDPELFLQELSPRLDRHKALNGLLGNEGDVYVDRQRAQCLELRLRVQAIEGVKESAVSVAKERCLAELRKQIPRVCQ